VGAWLFFFSSRRRHTRSYGDWSSDVCSSDLRGELARDDGDERGEPLGHPRPERQGRVGTLERALVVGDDDEARAPRLERVERLRSEERRVGKEGGSPWGPGGGRGKRSVLRRD